MGGDRGMIVSDKNQLKCVSKANWTIQVLGWYVCVCVCEREREGGRGGWGSDSV